MPASRFAEWAGAPAKPGVTWVTGVTAAGNTGVPAAFGGTPVATHAGLPRVTTVTTPLQRVPEVTQVTQHPKAGLSENLPNIQRGNHGNAGNPKIEQSADARRVADPAWWRDQFAQRVTHWEVEGKRPRRDAERLAWGELENRWNFAHGERVSRELCAGCRRPIGTEVVLYLIDGNRVHGRDGNDCLIRHGARWRATATGALIAMGLQPPAREASA
jgi:hypothetical protein